MYGSCGFMKAWSDMGPAPAVVCRFGVRKQRGDSDFRLQNFRACNSTNAHTIVVTTNCNEVAD